MPRNAGGIDLDQMSPQPGAHDRHPVAMSARWHETLRSHRRNLSIERYDNQSARHLRVRYRNDPIIRGGAVLIELAPVGLPQRESTGYLRLAFSWPRQLLSHAFAVLGPRGLVLAGFQRFGMGLAGLLVERFTAVAWLGWSEFGSWC